MGKRKNGQVESLESLLARPWCYYCDKDFDDINVLVGHQKAKHFQCTMPTCHRKLNTAGGLRVHLSQVHKEELPEVPNALEGRRDPNLEIFAMEGVPADLVETRTAYVTREYRRLEAEHYQKTGNPLPGTGGHQPSKRPKLESKEEMLTRLAAHTAKRKAEKAAAAANGSVPPSGTNSATDTPAAFPQATPTPPGAAGYGVPPPMGSVPMYPQASIAASSSPILPNMGSAWNQPPPPQSEIWRFDQSRASGTYAYPPPFAPSSSPPQGSVFPHPSTENDPGILRMGSGQAWPPTLPLPPHPDAPLRSAGLVFPPGKGLPQSLQQSIDGTGKPTGLPQRPLPAGQLPNRPNIPIQSEDASFNQDLEDLFDHAQANVARANAEENMKQDQNMADAKVKLQSGTTDEMGQPEPDLEKLTKSGDLALRDVTPEPREAPRKKDNKKQKVAATASGPTVGSRTNHLLHNDMESFEEMKASRYSIEPQPTAIPTEMVTQGANDPVDHGA